MPSYKVKVEIPANEVQPADAVASLRSLLCPACCGEKQRAKTLCGSCYHRLPRPTALALYSRSGQGYEQAIAVAFASLNLTAFTVERPAPCPT